MAKRPETTICVSVYLTSDELGRAFANRDNREQADILRAIVEGFDKPMDAEMQALMIGTALLETIGESRTEDAINFLRSILDSVATKAQKIATAATPKE